MEIKHFAQSFMGGRDQLEDRAESASVVTANSLQLDIAVVADGMGGKGKGQNAARAAIETFLQACKQSKEGDVVEIINQAFVAANAQVETEKKAHSELDGMGTTLAVAVVHDGRLYIGNAGDSRIYLIRGGQLIQLSRDHTLETKMRLQGKSEDYIKKNPNRTKLTNHIGIPGELFIDLGLYQDQKLSAAEGKKAQGLALENDDRILLCSDGLIKRTKELDQAVSKKELIDFARGLDPEVATQKLGELADGRGVSDNISVAIIDMGGKKTRIPVKLPRNRIVGTIAIFALLGLAAFFAFRNQDPPPTPPLEDNFAYVSEVSGNVLYSPAGTINPQPISRGDIFEAGEGAMVEVVGDGRLRLGLADNSIIFLDSDTKIELQQISNSEGTQPDTIITLIRGKLLVDADIQPGHKFLVVTDNNVVARVEGTIMGVFYDASNQQFQVDCLEGHCVVLDANGNEANLHAGEYADIFGLGDVSEIQPSRYEFWTDLADRNMLFTLTPTPENTITAAATVTAGSNSNGGDAGNTGQATKTEQRVTGAPSNTPLPPSNTPVPPSNTPVPPSNTPVPPSNTPVPPPDTPVPPPDTDVPPLDTDVPPEDTPEGGWLIEEAISRV